jgi:mRNA interferase MazF
MMESRSMIKNSIVLVPFPFDDYSTFKVRPALCLTEVIGKYDYIVIAFISSKIPDDLIDSDIIIEKDSNNYIGTGLTVGSVIRLHKIVTIPKSLIKRRLGLVNDSIDKMIRNKLQLLFKI